MASIVMTMRADMSDDTDDVVTAVQEGVKVVLGQAANLTVDGRAAGGTTGLAEQKGHLSDRFTRAKDADDGRIESRGGSDAERAGQDDVHHVPRLALAEE